ncbi:ABC transporter ATP-binding protein [Periweissella cryptocerci]|uniref:ABC transporter ATP-binding protein n=2 Tax=Periweissella cryptocerci TaxID=2506420 RepID=A0A4P6YUS6_9LACO|nr:ABC transporter ATP-binding protein [Periweissella cryptocerci]
MLEIKNLTHYFKDASHPLYQDVNLSFEPGKMYAVVGESGSGKTTLLSFLAGLDTPKQGQILLDGKDVNKIGLGNFRRDDVAIIFQSYNLLNYMSAYQNVKSALSITHSKHVGDKNYILAALAKVGIDEANAMKNVQQLSGGQQQRVAIVRAMLVDAPIVAADEPTGNLDAENSSAIVELFKNLTRELNKTVIIITHDQNVAQQADVQIQLADHQFKAN